MATVKNWRLLTAVQEANWVGGVGIVQVISGSVTLEYSGDNGTTWAQAGIDVGVDAAANSSFNFELPGCKIRLAGGTGRVGDFCDPYPDSMHYTQEDVV